MTICATVESKVKTHSKRCQEKNHALLKKSFGEAMLGSVSGNSFWLPFSNEASKVSMPDYLSAHFFINFTATLLADTAKDSSALHLN